MLVRTSALDACHTTAGSWANDRRRSSRGAALDGFELIERMSDGQWAVGWARGDDDRWPCFLEERQAISWMRDRVSRGRVFV
jgi:hypothetical protein